ncbi:MAG: STAS domain-containing protein [Vulcanimicrobiaceae bacterium]
MSKPVAELAGWGDVNVVTVIEEIDISNARSLEDQTTIALSSSPKLVVSLERCQYIDSSGLRVLIRLSNRHDVQFSVVVPPGTQTRRIFDLAGLEEQMAVFDTLQAAVAKFRAGATVRAN